jgi:hypothetical protein
MVTAVANTASDQGKRMAVSHGAVFGSQATAPFPSQVRGATMVP